MTGKAVVARPSGQVGVFDTRRVVATLEGLMERVTQEMVTPETVNAACNCADKIVDILRLHLDVERLQEKTRKARGEGP